MVQARYARKNLEAPATDGRIVHLNPGPNDEVEFRAPLALIMTKRAMVTGSRLRISPLSWKAEIVRRIMDRV